MAYNINLTTDFIWNLVAIQNRSTSSNPLKVFERKTTINLYVTINV